MIKMKKKISVTINEEKIKELERLLENGRFRNKSHVIEEAIKKTVKGKPYSATVYIDGIDKQKAKEVTNVLRGNGVTLRMVKSRRDESEPLIRLADMWAGCLRNADIKGGESKTLVARAIKEGYLTETTKT